MAEMSSWMPVSLAAPVLAGLVTVADSKRQGRVVR